MFFTETKIKGAFIIDVKKLEDERGFFGRAYCRNEFEQHGLNTAIVQANVSSNKKKGTLRGLHMQLAPHEETKFVRCTRGSIFDVLVDLRPDSDTYLQWLGITLKEDEFRMFYIPEGCAHGYLTLEDKTDVLYQVTAPYVPAAERGFRWDDPAFNIEWPIHPEIISEKDKAQPLFDARLLQV